MAQQGRVVRWARMAAVAGVMSSVACYNQVPVSEAPAAAGEKVTAILTPDGSVQMVPKVGPNVHEVDGRLVVFDMSTVTIALETTVGLDGAQQQWSGDRIAFPRSALEQLTTPKFSKKNTVLLGVATVAGVVILRGMLGGTSLIGGSQAGGPPTRK